jgi:hypothetical protein
VTFRSLVKLMHMAGECHQCGYLSCTRHTNIRNWQWQALHRLYTLWQWFVTLIFDHVHECQSQSAESYRLYFSQECIECEAVQPCR